ncbi:MAG: LysM peptidoglycan-binding domain-containing protein [Opitutae bacterium]|nr:LysM peptidoglycan-binding domain-containing protein [Opitutae bacterium]MBC9889170.1 LysM peptidoglycan-binding domain-containing protein [Opitutae bacterium]
MKSQLIIPVIVFNLILPALAPGAQNLSQPQRLPVRSQTAGLSQDVAMLKQQLGEIRLELERLFRASNSLQIRLKALEEKNSGSGFISEKFFNQELVSLRSEVNRLNKANKEQIISQVSAQIRALASETEKSIQSLAGVGGAPATLKVVEFSDNYPKSGIYYKVQTGDTISKIAKESGSKVSYIINANKIPNPDRLMVGKELFIPVDNPN